jgi:TatD DNase family protein
MKDFLVDSHCHLNMLLEKGYNIKDILRKADGSNVKIMQSICTEIGEFEKILKLARQNNNIYCSVGIHPEGIKDKIITVKELVEKSQDKNVIGIGEVGLEYHYDNSSKDMQKKNFEVHIEASRQTALPLIIHSRDADKDMMEILDSEMKNGEFPFVLHCFSSGKELAFKGLDLGGYISLSGIITFKNAKKLREIIKDIPLDRLMLETDAPYLCPEPKRGQINEPAYVDYIAKYLVDFLKISYKDICSTTTENFLRLFNKVKV